MVDQKDINDYFNRQTFLNLDTKKPKRLERNNSLKYLRNINKCALDLIQGQDTGPNVDAQIFQNKRNLRRRMREEKMALRWELHALHKDMRKNIEEIRETEETIINEFGPEKKPSNTVKKLKTIKENKGTIQRNAMKKKLKIASSLPIKKISTRQSNKSLSTGCMSFTGMNSSMVSSPELTKVIKENVNNNKKVFNINQAQIIKAKSTSLLPIKSKLKKRVAPRNRQKEIVPLKVETVYNTIKQNIEKPKKDPKGEEKVNNLIKTFYTTRHSSINQYTKENFYNSLNNLKFQVQYTNIPDFVNKMHHNNPPNSVAGKIKLEEKYDDQILTFHHSFVKCLLDPFL